MPDLRRSNCIVCGRHASQVGAISWSGKCRGCGKAIMNENCESISAGVGWPHEWRLRGYERMLERARLDDGAKRP